MKKGTVSKIFRVFFKIIRIPLVLFISFAVMFMLVIMKPEADRQVPKQSGLLVEVMPVQAEQVNLYVEAYGTVRPREALSQ